MREFDLLAIGSGPGGQKAAIQAAKLKKRVAVIEKERELGGACANTGTLPSKTLKDEIYHLHGFKLRSLSSISHTLKKNMHFNDLMERKDLVIEHEREVILSQLMRNGVEIIHGAASFTDPNTLRVAEPDGHAQSLRAQNIVIGTGSRPRRPANIPFNDITVCDSNSILCTDFVPRSMTVMGGGVIGCEYASMFASFGIKVTLLDQRTDLMRFADQEIVQALVYQMRSNGLTLRMGEAVEKVEMDELGRAVIRLQSGKVIITDMLLYAMGRTANTDTLNLGAAGLAADEKTGQVKVNENYQTEVAHIYAVGDVIGFPALAATSMEQGRLAACHAFNVGKSSLPTVYPIGIYTVPEISMVGKTEEELTAEGVSYEVGRAFYKEIARGQIIGDLDGMMKLVFHRDTLKLLGVHIIGDGATELVHIGQAVLTYGGTVDFFVQNVFNFPTLAECYRTAAFDGINRLGRA